jgi:hypothetical protein
MLSVHTIYEVSHNANVLDSTLKQSEVMKIMLNHAMKFARLGMFGDMTFSVNNEEFVLSEQMIRDELARREANNASSARSRGRNVRSDNNATKREDDLVNDRETALKILGVSKFATIEQCRASWKLLVLKHRDDESATARVNNAYNFMKGKRAN